MEYHDTSYGFSFHLPDGWRKREATKELAFIGPGYCAGELHDYITIAIGKLLPHYEEPSNREEYYREPGAIVCRDQLAAETNVVLFERSDHSEISALHDGIHYIIQHGNDSASRQAVTRLRETFRFGAPSQTAAAMRHQTIVQAVIQSGSADEAERILHDAGIAPVRVTSGGGRLYRMPDLPDERAPQVVQERPRRRWEFWK